MCMVMLSMRAHKLRWKAVWTGVVEDDGDWTSEIIFLSKEARVREILLVDLAAIQPQCHEFSI